ncbi:hypothetical protein V1264_019985 [Littorina saxatilis]|uniref:Cadherin domain-containing protein n=1 Tax=Littorina saxatilis TaxID=31220 RepID=A0AAN9B940_9CAEN
MSRHGAWSVWSVVILFWPAAMAQGPPTWTNVAADDTTTASVSEDATADTSVFTLSATGDALTYSLVTTSSEFKLVGQELQVLAGAGLDFESGTTSYVLTVRVSAAGGQIDGTLTVQVTGVNDNNPTWGTWIPGTMPATPSITYREDTSIGTVFFEAKANDADVGTGSTITYTLDSVVDNNGVVAAGVFKIDPVNGAVYTLQTLDRDSAITSYDLTVKANDGGSSPITQVVTVTLDDVNDIVPVFSPATYSVSKAETDALANSNLVQVTATDTDESPTLTYTLGSVLVGNPSAKFRMAPTSGLLELASAIDLDTGDAAYTVLEVLVTDSNTAPINTATTTVTIIITPSNEHDPVFDATVPTTNPIPLSESVAVGTSVATVPATDADAGSDGTVTYSITDGNTGNVFTIIPTTGEIRTLTELNFENTQTYTLQVTATDGGTPTAKTAVTTVNVSVTNENDNPPTCPDYYIPVTLAEDKAVTDPVASLGCSDADTVTGATLTYTITSGNGDGKFAIDPNAGAITLAQTVDYDSATQSYKLQAVVSDDTNTQTVTVKVTVTPVNQATPSFTSSPTATSVREDEEAGYLVHTYTATDSDYAPHGITAYAITAVTHGGGGKFTIDQSSGTIRLLSPLDYDALPTGNQVYELTVTATDGGGLVGTGTVTVAVQDVNDNAPTCTQSSWSATVLENVATFPHEVIASLGCTDTEDGTTLTYALTQTPGSLFSEAGGAIQLGSAVDYETAPSYTITVVVTDAGIPQLSTTVVVNVNVQNVNDGPPTFTGTFDVTLQEGIAIGTSVADVSASDPDGATNAFGNPQHSIINGDPSGQFSIDSSTGRVTTRAALDADTTQVHTLTIKATEQGGGANTATVSLTVSVTDLNDNTPSCNVNTFALPVAEPSAANTAILTLTCTDGDVTPTTLTYTLQSGDATKFEMNSNVLQVKALLDYDGGTTQYPLTIRVSDGTNNVDISGSVTVTAVNEASPVFSPATYAVSKSESLAVGNPVVQVTATDSDSNNTPDGVIIYAFDASSPQTKFTINSATGAILLSSSLDREVGGSSYSILVTASDGTNTVTATVTLTVTDENDNAPIFSAATYTAQVSESAAAGAAVVVTVTANDADDTATNQNGVVSYAITGGDPSNHFTIVSTTGAITTSTQLDADVVNSYSLTVTATDRAGAAGALTSTAVVIVTVTSVNQYEPVFTQTPYTASTDESAPVGTTLVQVVASDADTGNDGTVTYSMTPHAKFSLAADGWIAVKAALDFETSPNSYAFNVIATDGGSPPKAATETVTITVGDVNDNTAMCTPSTITVQKREDATGAVTSLSCTDADSGTNANLVYTIQSVNGVAGAGNFVVAANGAVTVSALDYETASSLAVVISVADQGTTPRTTSVYLTVTVTDVNDYAPVFPVTSLAANVAEDKTVGDTVITVTATDSDGSDIITYSLDDTTKLQVDPASGVVTLKTPFDFETVQTYTVNVLATDSNTVDATKTSTVLLTLTITDVNDNSPVFNPSVYAASVDENNANGVTVTTVTASDADTADTIAYSIVNGNTNNVFRVDGGAGHIIVDDNSFLDYETNPTFTLTVRAEDGRGKSADVVVNIGVNPLNENTPNFTPASSTQSLAENLPGSSSFVTVAATDTDGGSDGALTYSIASGASGKFAVNPSSGAISLVGSLDRETTQQYVIQIIAVDGGVNPAAKTGTYTLTIDVTDVNDVTPSCSATFFTASIPEDATGSASVKDITGCVDNDMDPANLNNALTYTIKTGNTGSVFQIDAAGQVTVQTATFDREATPAYTLNIEVADQATTTKLTSTVTLQVDISDINDITPVFSSDPYNFNVAEDKAIGVTVQRVTATDGDTGSNAALTFSLTSSTPSAGKFRVDPSTGDVTVAAALDFETEPAYVLVVTATDQGTTPRSVTTTVSVTVSDVDDRPPVCVQSVYTVTLAEDNPLAVVVTVSCPDGDTASVTYTMTHALFAVDATSGVVTLTGALDYETAQSHTLTITASDGTRTDVTTVQVTVTDVNEHPPVFVATTPYLVSLPEDSSIGTTVKDVNAADADLGSTTLIFTITTGNADGKFSMNSVTGVIVLQGSLDRETLDTYTLILEVKDGTGAGSLTATTSIIVTVSDVNDNAPTCNPGAYGANIAEDATTGAAVVTLTCSDVDTTTTAVRYTLLAAGNTGTAFAIDADSGALTLTGPGILNYETLTSYTLTVEVDDKATPAKTTTVPVTVTVTPVNEQAPAFPGAGYGNTDVKESTAVGADVITVAASDTDTGLQHGTVRYSIVGGNTAGDFLIDSSTGKITVAHILNREDTPSYTLTVRAADDVAGSANEKSDDVIVGITITDANDNYPVFTPAAYSTTILETAAATGTVITITVSDDDTGPNAALTVTIKSGNTGGAFSMTGNDLVLATALDYETTQFYDLVIEAVDGGALPLTSQVT